MDLPPSPEILLPVKNNRNSFPCRFIDSEETHQISHLLLPSLAAACIDCTAGDPFRQPASVALQLRQELQEHLLKTSETHFLESRNSQNDRPSEIIADFLDDFAGSRKSLIGAISGWLLSEFREDKIDDLAQEMEEKGFWPQDQREALAETLIRDLDLKEKFCCKMVFDEFEELAAHEMGCRFRPVNCVNNGCKALICAIRLEEHDSVCPFKMIKCEQKCEMNVPRREMDRHCITICSMKLVNCPFYQVGCSVEAFPQHQVERHCTEFLRFHVLHVLKLIHKEEAESDEMKRRVQRLEKFEDLSQLAEAMDVRSLTFAIKKMEAKLIKVEP
ncbi:TRAF-like superfamily protein [Wolffia australiana]